MQDGPHRHIACVLLLLVFHLINPLEKDMTWLTACPIHFSCCFVPEHCFPYTSMPSGPCQLVQPSSSAWAKQTAMAYRFCHFAHVLLRSSEWLTNDPFGNTSYTCAFRLRQAMHCRASMPPHAFAVQACPLVHLLCKHAICCASMPPLPCQILQPPTHMMGKKDCTGILSLSL